jgi:hypothetical protein
MNAQRCVGGGRVCDAEHVDVDARRFVQQRNSSRTQSLFRTVIVHFRLRLACVYYNAIGGGIVCDVASTCGRRRRVAARHRRRSPTWLAFVFGMHVCFCFCSSTYCKGIIVGRNQCRCDVIIHALFYFLTLTMCSVFSNAIWRVRCEDIFGRHRGTINHFCLFQ